MKAHPAMQKVPVLIVLSLVILLGGPAPLHASPKADQVQKGDLVTVQATLRLPDGGLIFTTDPSRSGAVKAPGYVEQDCLVPLKLIAGEEGPVPGLNEIMGMSPGEKRTVTLTPEKAYGTVDRNLLKSFDCIRTEPRKASISPREYVDQTNKFPVPGKVARLNPYFTSKVAKVSENSAEIENLAKDGSVVDGPIGKATIRVKGDAITITLMPVLGAQFDVGDRQGRIVSTDGKTFTVDLNNPLAGKSVVLEVEVLSSTRGSVMGKEQIPWSEDYTVGLARAKSENKPVVLVLYASWCQWSRRFFEETCADPRIKAMKDRFVWVRIDSDKNGQYYEQYNQKGFPFTVILGPDGAGIEKLSGFMEAARLDHELSCIAYGQKSRQEDAPGGARSPSQGCSGGQ